MIMIIIIIIDNDNDNDNNIIIIIILFFLIKSTPIPKKKQWTYNTFKWQDRTGLTRLNEV